MLLLDSKVEGGAALSLLTFNPFHGHLSVALTRVNVRDLLECELLEFHAVAENFEASASCVENLAKVGDVFTVIDVNVTAQSVFDWHGQNVAELLALFHQFLLDISCGFQSQK